MEHQSIVFSIFVIFTGAAVLSTLALYTRQSLLVAYIAVGALLGPWGFRLVTDSGTIQQVGNVGISFLLFLLGLELQPQNLWHMLRKATWVTLASSMIFAVVGFFVAYIFGYGMTESVIVGAAMMFSSTIIGLKLLPASALHQQHIGEIVISVLLLQDLIAIVVLLMLHAGESGGVSMIEIGSLALALPGVAVFAYLLQRYALVPLLQRFDKIQEYIFLLSIAWCLGISELSKFFHLSHEIGAFIAGVAVATSPIALYIADSLKPLRDFFLVLFFFSIGASFNFHFLPKVAVPAIILATAMLLIKPLVYRLLLRQVSETEKIAWEVGIRLGQISEFSLLIAYLAASSVLIGESANYLIQAATLLTFIASSYVVVLRYPTPLAFSDKLRQN